MGCCIPYAIMRTALYWQYLMSVVLEEKRQEILHDLQQTHSISVVFDGSTYSDEALAVTIRYVDMAGSFSNG